ncbi:MAG: ATP-binding protein [Isosphaeraceae bacterium]
MDRILGEWLGPILASMTDAVVATDVNTRIVFVNRAAEALTEWSRSEVQGRNVVEVVPLHDEQTGQRATWPAVDFLATGEHLVLPPTLVLTTRSGRRIPIEGTRSPIKNAGGQTVGSVLVLRDTSARREAAQRILDDLDAMTCLQEVGNRCANPELELSECLSLILDAALRITGSEQGHIQLFDPDRNALVIAAQRGFERPFLDFFAEVRGHNGATCGSALSSARQVVVPDVTQSTLFAGEPALDVLLDAGVRAVQSTPLIASNGRVLGMISTHFARPQAPNERSLRMMNLLARQAADLLERQRSQQALKTSEEELSRRVQVLQALFDAAPVGINVAEDPECRVIRGNRALSEMLGMPPGENVSKSGPAAEKTTYRIVANGRELEPHELPMQRAAAENRELRDEVMEIVRDDGTRIPVLVNAKPIRSRNGRVLGAVGICLDVSQLKSVEARLRDADRRKDEFLAMLAHELRNPLAAVVNAAGVLKLSDDPECVQFAKDIIERQTRLLAHLIDDLLDASRINSGKIRIQRKPCDAGTIVKHAIASVEPLIKERQHHLITRFVEGTLPLEADQTRIEQIVVNLITNAAKYTENGGTIEVEASRQGDEIVIAVRDDGDGIPPESLPRMFDLFAQGERSIARSEGGLGIGLTIVQKLAELHDGRVTAESDGPGKGSTFTVRLPAASPPAPSPPGSDTAPTAARRGTRILVVDDNEDTALGMVRLLRLLGNDAVGVYDGPAALDAARRFHPEYVLLDIGLPGMDGYEIARKIRQEPGCNASFIIAVSGYGQDDDRRRSREAGIDHHLVKPVDFDLLATLLSQNI